MNTAIDLNQEIDSLRAQLAERDRKIVYCNSVIEGLQERINTLLRKRFGSSSEKLPSPQMALFNEAEEFNDDIEEAVEEEPVSDSVYLHLVKYNQ